MALASKSGKTDVQFKSYADITGQIQDKWIEEAKIFKKNILDLHNKVEDRYKNNDQTIAYRNILKEELKKCRYQYKKSEYLLAFYTDDNEKMLNGPDLMEEEEDEGNIVIYRPTGLQVVENILYDDELYAQAKDSLRIYTSKLIGAANRQIVVAENQGINEINLSQAIREEIIRIYSMGLAGFDAPQSGLSLQEAFVSWKSIQLPILMYLKECKNKKLKAEIMNSLKIGDNYLKNKKGIEALDRIEFIAKAADPLYRQLQLLDKELNLSPPIVENVFTRDGSSLWSVAGWRPIWFGGQGDTIQETAKAELGRLLFYDPVISGNAERSCASCHNPNKFFTDGQARATGFDAVAGKLRNTPTLLNAALQSSQFYDNSVATLEDQAAAVTLNKSELHGNFEETGRRLVRSKEYVLMFLKAFPNENGKINARNILMSLAAYERSLLSFDSRLDKYIRGEKDIAISKSERNGFNIFMGKGLCGTCHFAPLFNGTVPPHYVKSEMENLGVPVMYDTANLVADPDLGRYNVTGREGKKGMFKTPSVRFSAHTAPYFHNGSYKTLDQVIDFYVRGGGAGMGLDNPWQSLPFDKLDLSTVERTDLINFLKMLSPDINYSLVPTKLPEINGAFDRTVGGKY